MYSINDLHKLQQFSVWLKWLSQFGRVAIIIVISTIIVAIALAPEATDGMAAYSVKMLEVKELHTLGLPFNIKMGLLLNFTILIWIAWKIFTPLIALFNNFHKGDVFADNNAHYCLDASKYFFFGFLLTYLFKIAMAITLGLPLNGKLLIIFLQFPLKSLIIAALIYAVAYLIKLSIALDKNVRATV